MQASVCSGQMPGQQIASDSVVIGETLYPALNKYTTSLQSAATEPDEQQKHITCPHFGY